MDNQIDVSNPLSIASGISASGAPGAPVAPVSDTPVVPVNPLAIAPGATEPPIPTVGVGTLARPEGINPQQPPRPPAAEARPGSFAQKLFSAVTGVLSAASNTGQRALAATGDPAAVANLERQENQRRYQAEQARLAQDRQDKLTDQQRIQRREDEEAHTRTMLANATAKHTRYSDYIMGDKRMDEQIMTGVHDRDSMLSTGGAEGIASPVQSGVDGAQMHALLKDKDNPINAYEYTAFPASKKQTGVDEDGKPTYDFTYDIVKVPKHWTTQSDEQVARIRTTPGKENFVKGTDVSGALGLQWLNQANMIKATKDAVNKARTDAGMDELNEEQKGSLTQFSKSGDALKYLNAHSKPGHLDIASAAAHMIQDPAMIKKYGTSLYNDVMATFFGDKKDVTGKDGYNSVVEKEKELNQKQEEIDLKAAADKGDFSGNETLVGDAFLKSLIPKEQLLVKQAGDGQMRATNLAMLMRGKSGPAFAEAVSRYAPDFQGDKVDAYYKAMTEYNDDKPGSVGGTLNAGGTALKTLRRLYDSTTTSSLIPGSIENKKRQADLQTAAIEVAKFQAGGRQPGVEDIDRARKILDPEIPLTGGMLANPINRRESVKEATELVQKKLQEYEDMWNQKAPSPRYQSPMPNISAAARVDSAYVLNNGKYAVPRGAQAFVDPKTNHQIFTFDGTAWYDASNGQLIRPAGGK